MHAQKQKHAGSFRPRDCLARFSELRRVDGRRSPSMDGDRQNAGAAGLREHRAAGAAAGSDLLLVANVSKRFGGTQALDQVGMRLEAGEIVALLGENGAGKSTLIKILAGVYTLDEGRISFRGRDVSGGLRRLPIAFIHQDLGLIDWMTVADNICLTLGFPRRRGLIDWNAARRRGGAPCETA